MAKRAEKGKEGAAKASGTRAGTPVPTPEPGGKGESVAAYFRKVFEENPKLLKQRSNDELFRRWLEDHPGHHGVPQPVKWGPQNIKGGRRKGRGKRGRPQRELPANSEGRAPRRDLEALDRGLLACLV